MCLHHLNGLLRQFYAGLIGCRDQCHDRTLTLPGHCRGKLGHRINRVEQGAVPVVFQDAPATLDRILETLVI